MTIKFSSCLYQCQGAKDAKWFLRNQSMDSAGIKNFKKLMVQWKWGGGGSSRNRADRPCTSENLFLKSKPLAKNVFAEIALKPLHEVV